MISIHEVPILRVLLFLILGILLPFYSDVCLMSYTLGFLVFSVLFTFIASQFKWHKCFGLFLPISIVLVGCSLSLSHYPNLDSASIRPEACSKHYFIVEIIDEVKKKNYYSFTANLSKMGSSLDCLTSVDLSVKCYINAQVDASQLRIGNTLLIEGDFAPITSSTNPFAFDYARFLNRRGIQYSISVHDSKVLMLDGSTILRQSFFDRLRSQLKFVIDDNITISENAEVSKAMLLGDKSDLSQDVYQIYSNTGAVHVLAVSGLHVGIIASLVYFFLGLFGLGSAKYKAHKAVLVIAVIWFYAFLTGMSPSVIRSSVMFTAFLGAIALKRNAYFYNILASTAIVLLCYKPNFIFDLGFQLSFLAVASIVFFMPFIRQFLPHRDGYLGNVISAINVTISAQILIFPLLVFYFHKIPVIFVFSSIIAVFAAYLVLISGFLMLFCSLFGGGALRVTSYLHEIILAGLNKSLAFMDSIPGSSIQNVWLDFPVMIIAYLGILVFMGFILYRKTTYLVLSITLFVASILLNEWIVREKTSQNKLVIYDAQRSSLLDVFTNARCYSLGDDDLDSDMERSIASNFRMVNRAKKLVSLTRDQDFQDSNISKQKEFVQLGDLLIYQPDSIHFMVDDRIDLYWLTDDFASSWNYKLLSDIDSTAQVVLDASIPYWKKDNLLPYLNGKTFWDIKTQGAFVRRF